MARDGKHYKVQLELLINFKSTRAANRDPFTEKKAIFRQDKVRVSSRSKPSIDHKVQAAQKHAIIRSCPTITTKF